MENMAEGDENFNLIDHAFRKIVRQTPADYALDYLYSFCVKLAEGSEYPLDESARKRWAEALAANNSKCFQAIIQDIRDSVPDQAVNAVYVSDPKHSLPVDPEVVQANVQSVKNLWDELRTTNTKLLTMKKEVEIMKQLLGSGKELLEDERLVEPSIQDAWSRFPAVVDADSGIMSDEESVDGRGFGYEDGEEDEGKAFGTRGGRHLVEHSMIQPRKVGGEEEDEDGGKNEANGDATRVICTGNASVSSKRAKKK